MFHPMCSLLFVIIITQFITMSTLKFTKNQNLTKQAHLLCHFHVVLLMPQYIPFVILSIISRFFPCKFQHFTHLFIGLSCCFFRFYHSWSFSKVFYQHFRPALLFLHGLNPVFATKMGIFSVFSSKLPGYGPYSAFFHRKYSCKVSQIIVWLQKISVRFVPWIIFFWQT